MTPACVARPSQPRALLAHQPRRRRRRGDGGRRAGGRAHRRRLGAREPARAGGRAARPHRSLVASTGFFRAALAPTLEARRRSSARFADAVGLIAVDGLVAHDGAAARAPANVAIYGVDERVLAVPRQPLAGEAARRTPGLSARRSRASSAPQRRRPARAPAAAVGDSRGDAARPPRRARQDDPRVAARRARADGARRVLAAAAAGRGARALPAARRAAARSRSAGRVNALLVAERLGARRRASLAIRSRRSSSSTTRACASVDVGDAACSSPRRAASAGPLASRSRATAACCPTRSSRAPRRSPTALRSNARPVFAYLARTIRVGVTRGAVLGRRRLRSRRGATGLDAAAELEVGRLARRSRRSPIRSG